MFYHVLPNYQHQKSLLLSFFGGIPRPVPVVPVVPAGPGSSAPNSSREASEASKNAIPSLKPRPQLQWRASRPDSSGGWEGFRHVFGLNHHVPHFWWLNSKFPPKVKNGSKFRSLRPSGASISSRQPSRNSSSSLLGEDSPWTDGEIWWMFLGVTIPEWS